MVGQVIREALAAYRRVFAPLTAATILIFLPFAAALLALELAAPDSTSTRQGLMIIDGVGSLLLFAPLAAITAIRTGRALEHGETSVRRHVGEAFGLLVPYVATQLLMLLVIAGLPGALIAAGYAAGSSLVMTLGAGLLIGSALINGVRLTCATVAVAVGDARFAPALRRSAGLTRGSWLVVFGTLITATLLALLATLGLSAIALPFPAGAAQDVGATLAELLANGVTVPFIALVTYRLYRALEARVQRAA